MKKSILNIGKALNKIEQKSINGGGFGGSCNTNEDCPVNGHICNCGDCIDPRKPFLPCL
jgi:hypothetical protein